MSEDCRQIGYNFELAQIKDIGNYIGKVDTVRGLSSDLCDIQRDYKNNSNYDAAKSRLIRILGIGLDSVFSKAVWVSQGGAVPLQEQIQKRSNGI